MTKEEHFLYYATRIQERITIINRSIEDGSDITEHDILILRGIFDWYNKDTYDWLNKVIKPQPIIEQGGIFSEKQ